MGKLRWWCFSPIAIEMLYNWDFGRSQAFQGKGNLFQTSNYWITKERSSQVLKGCFHVFAPWSKSGYLNASQDFQINWLTLLFSLSGCPNLDIWKWLLAFFLFLFFSHMHLCHWYEDPTIDLASCNFQENTWKVIFGIYLWLLHDGMDEQNIGEKSFSMKLHILANVDYMTLNYCILDLNFFLDISHLYWGLGKFVSMPSPWTKSPYI